MHGIYKIKLYPVVLARWNTLYDLLVMVPVDLLRDTDLTTVNPVKSGSRVTIHYATTSLGTTAPYRFRHWEIDSEGTYLDIEIRGDNLPERSQVLAFADADLESATVTWQMQTCAPYLFGRVEMVAGVPLVHPSCIILFDPGLGSLTENINFAPNKTTINFNMGNNGVITDPAKFTINRQLQITPGDGLPYNIEAAIAAFPAAAKPPRRSTRRVVW
ncbi:MAG: hypothetical protein J0M29_20200 [Chitinophagales bacterium]|nr:hypothetical protein [Chitinophagales bacterium]